MGTPAFSYHWAARFVLTIFRSGASPMLRKSGTAFGIFLNDDLLINAAANDLRQSPRSPILVGVKGFVAAIVIALALYFLFRHLADLSVGEIHHALRGFSSRPIEMCAVLTLISFLALGCYDMIAVRLIAPDRASSPRAWLVGAIANAISNTIGFHALTATAVRYRLFSRSGLTNAEIASVTLLSWSALFFAFVTTFSLALAISPRADLWQRGSGLVLLAMLILGARLLGSGKALHFRQYNLPLPPERLALAQMALGTVEMVSAIGALYVLLPATSTISFPAFCTLYIGAVLLGIVSHMPGGLGVFEASILAFSGNQNRAEILAALLIYRLIYNICPFLLAALALATEEIRTALSSRADSA